MSFHMPEIYIKDVSYSVAIMLAKISDHKGRLKLCPPHHADDWLKFFHNVILRELYKDPRWTVPVWHAWGMPHTLSEEFESAQKILTPLVSRLINSEVFRDPQPVYIGNKTYHVTNQDGSTFRMTVQ